VLSFGIYFILAKIPKNTATNVTTYIKDDLIKAYSYFDKIKNLDKKKSVSGGDNNASRMYLLNLQKLFSSDVIKAFKQKT